MDTIEKDTPAPGRRRLTASPARIAAVQRAAILPPAQQMRDKQPEKSPVAELDPAGKARRRTRRERSNALYLTMRQTWPALFGTGAAVPLAVGVHDVLVERLGLDVEGGRDLRSILCLHVGRYAYHKALIAEGAVRRDLEGNPVGELTAEQRAFAEKKIERLKSKMAERKTRDGK